MNKDDRILPITRFVSVVVIPFLWLAFLILYFYPDLSGERFAWAIRPHMTAMYMAAGYLGGSWLFIQAVFGRRWHRIQGGFLPITTFTWFMLFATFLHWDRFSHSRLGFTLWLILYIVTPFLVPALWLTNRKTDPGEPEARDVLISPTVSIILKLISAGSLLYAVVGFVDPDLVITTWPWTLTPLTARVMCGWVALLGVGALTMSMERRWSGWKVPLESIAIWHILVFLAAFMNSSDFKNGLLNWYTASIGVMLIGIFVFYPMMEMRRRKLTPDKVQA
jgi:hypothetical protein